MNASPDTSHSHDASYRTTVTYGGSGIDFEKLWPPLDPARLAVQQGRWRAEAATRRNGQRQLGEAE